MVEVADALPKHDIASSEVRYGSAWGSGEVRVSERSIAGRKLKYCVEAVRGQTGLFLEIGCGQGKFIRGLRTELGDQNKYYGCDLNSISLEKIETCQKHSIHYSAGNITHLPYESGSFDTVILFDVLEHVEDVYGSVREIYRVLKPNGVFHAFVPCEGNWFSLHGLFSKLFVAKLKEELAGHVQQFQTHTLLGQFRGFGFRLEHIKYSGYLFEQLFDVLFYIGLKSKLLHTTLTEAHADENATARKRPQSRFQKIGVICLRAIRNLMFFIDYWESVLLARLPYSLGIHVTLRKGGASRVG
jgi:ubiquinone/menaquinone biosynthesis C-methylase UbiE